MHLIPAKILSVSAIDCCQRPDRRQNMGFFRSRIGSLLGRRERRQTLQEAYPQYRIGRGTYGGPTILSWNEGASLQIGNFCSIADGVTIFLGGEHRSDWVTTFPFNVLWPAASDIFGHPKTKGDVIIGSDVWLGNEAVILSGSKLGHGAIIGARAVVTKDVPPYAIVAGNPGRIVKYRFEPAVVDRLLRVAWWEWSDHTIEKFLPFLLSTDIDLFLDEAERLDECGVSIR
jgi:acetyltransferase-like isoleucine patch superfamily enzyme